MHTVLQRMETQNIAIQHQLHSGMAARQQPIIIQNHAQSSINQN